MPTTMDAKQLAEAGKLLAKASEGGDSAATILALLQPLQDFVATESLLRSSKIGVYVNKLRGNKDPKVSEPAARLINKWKADVKKASSRPSGSPAPAAGAKANGAQAGNGTSSPGKNVSSPAPGGKMEDVKRESRKSTVPKELRTAEKDQVNTKLTKDPSRDGCIKLLYNGLCFMSDESPDDIILVARNVELAAFNEYSSQKDYTAKVRSLFMNLKMKDNASLREDVFSGHITPQQFVKMSTQDLKSDQRKKSDAQLEKENMKESMTAEPIKSISTTMPCGRCGGRKTAYTQAQTRSADEPMTNFCECTVCGNRWKFSG